MHIYWVSLCLTPAVQLSRGDSGGYGGKVHPQPSGGLAKASSIGSVDSDAGSGDLGRVVYVPPPAGRLRHWAEALAALTAPIGTKNYGNTISKI